MTGKFFNAFWPIVVTIIGGYSVYFFTQDKVELQYYLTEPIPVLLSNGEVLESVQQLTVINSGEVTIESIGIKIKGKIKEANIIKNFVDDKFTQNITDTFLQAKYFKLPPNSKFSYIIKSSIGGVTSSHIDISYSKGKAVNALDPKDNSNAFALIYILLAISYLIYITISTFKDRKLNSLNFSSYEDILTVLNEPKPYYVNQNDWDSARKKYIENKRDIKYFHRTNIQDNESYKILNAEKPHNFSDFEWTTLIDTMLKHFIDLFDYKVKCSSKAEYLLDLISIDRPKNIPELKWKELNKKACEELFSISNVDQYGINYFSKPSTKYIMEKTPKNFDKGMWSDYLSALKSRYFIYILFDLSEKISSSLLRGENYDLDLLDKGQKQEIEQFIYKLKFKKFRNITSIYEAKSFMESSEYVWLNEDDRLRLEEIASAYINLEENIEEYKSLLSSIESLVSGMKLGNKPKELNSEVWAKLKEIEHKVIGLSEKNSKESSLIEKEKVEVSEMKIRVVKQLSIISQVLSNPKTVFEIEDYDNPFAEGNFNNLKQVAEVLGRE